MDYYCFLVAHSVSDVKTNLLSVYPDVKRWISERGDVERSGGSGGKVVKFNEKKYLQDLSLGKLEAIELYSERKWRKGEVSEVLNSDFSVVFSNGTGLMLSANKEKIRLSDLLDSFLMMGHVVEAYDYAYAYVETHAYGTGYARGIYMPDEIHPLMWGRRSEAGAWMKKQWSNDTGSYIRDIYQLNMYSSRKIEALPHDKRQALTQAMERYGECSVQKGFSVWALEDAELEMAREYLKGFKLLASYL